MAVNRNDYNTLRSKSCSVIIAIMTDKYQQKTIEEVIIQMAI